MDNYKTIWLLSILFNCPRQLAFFNKMVLPDFFFYFFWETLFSFFALWSYHSRIFCFWLNIVLCCLFSGFLITNKQHQFKKKAQQNENFKFLLHRFSCSEKSTCKNKIICRFGCFTYLVLKCKNKGLHSRNFMILF